MPKREYDFRGVEPARGGTRRDYITPGFYRFKVKSYDGSPSQGGRPMDTFVSEVITRGDQAGKKITDRFVIPRGKESKYPLQRLLAFFEACGVAATGKKASLDPSRIVGREFDAEVFDQQEEARKVGDTTYPARVVSALQYGGEEAEDDDDDELDDEDLDDEEEDEEDEEDEDEDEDDDDDEEEEEEDDEEDEDEDEEDDDDEEPVAPPRRRGRPAATAVATRRTKAAVAKPAAKKATAKAEPAKGKAKAAAKPAARSRRAEPDFPFDD